ncbi:AvrE-family type 3 secretion system effector [Salinicola avicenniae]|uniref:AvrE-family type 3 secretion system effector n=1 Tax=Salinicola avicenniae TaxID=2916836 RepID=UPI002073532B|nr:MULTISPECIES: AvrE-family type 3 secretion system effector [unclassified Salinicola]
MNRVSSTLNAFRFQRSSDTAGQPSARSSHGEGASRARLHETAGLVQQHLKSRLARAGRLLHLRGRHAATSETEVTQGRPGFRVFSTFKPSQTELNARRAEAARGDDADANDEPERPRLENGRFRMASGAGRYLEERLNHENARFVEGQEDGSGFRFRDQQGRDFHVQQTQIMAGALRASQRRAPGDARANPPGAPDREHLGVVSGIHGSRDEGQYRLVGTRVHRYDDQGGDWQALADETRYQRLARHADGRVYGTPSGAWDVSISADGFRFDLPRRDNSRIRISELPGRGPDFAEGRDIGLSLRLTQADGRPLKATRIAHASDQVLYAADQAGTLFRTDALPALAAAGEDVGSDGAEPTYFYLDGEEDAPIRSVADRSGRLFETSTSEQSLAMVPFDMAPIEAFLGRQLKTEGFMHDESGRLNLLVRDRHDQLHSVYIDENANVQPGWNLTDAVVMTLAGADRDAPSDDHVVDLGRRGNLALHEGTLRVQGPDEANWSSTRIDGIDRLEQGLDNVAYILRHGKVRPLDIQYTGSRMPVDDLHELSPSQRRTRVAMDKTIAGGGGQTVQAFAVADRDRFLTLDDQGACRARVDGRDIAIPLPAGVPSARDLALDGDQTLHLLDARGRLHSLARRQWQRLMPDTARWQATAPPAGLPVDSVTSDASGQLSASAGGRRFSLRQSASGAPTWQPGDRVAREVPLAEGAAGRLHEQLQQQHDPGKGMRHGDAHTTETHSVFGSAGNSLNPLRQRHAVSDMANHLRPRGDAGRAMRDLGRRNGGRDDLQTLYREERAMVARLPQLVAASPAAAPADLAARVEALRQGEPADARLPLLTSLEHWGEKLDTRSYGDIIRLGEIHRQQTPADSGLIGRARQRLSGRAGDAEAPNLLADIHRLLLRYPGTADNRSAQALGELLQRGMVIAYPTRQTERDRRDPTAILRASLIQNGDTLRALHEIAAGLESEAASGLPEGRLDALKQRFDQLIYDGFDTSELQQYAAASFNSYRSLERVAAAHEALNRDLAESGRPLNRHLQRTLEGGDNLEQALTTQVRSMREGDETKLGTSRSGTLATPYLFPAPGVPIYTSASASAERGNEMKVARRDEGVKLSLSRKQAASLSNTWGTFLVSAGGVTESPMPRINDQASSGLFSGVDLDGSVSRSTQDSLAMNLHGNEIQSVMRHFTQRNARLLDLLRIGHDPSVSRTVTQQAQLDLSAIPADLRISLGDTQSSPSAWFRAGIGLSGSLNLVTREREHKETHGPGGKVEQATRHRTDLFSQASAGVLFRPVQAVASSEHAFQRVPLEISSKITLDRSKANTFSVAFKTPQTVKPASIDKLVKSLKEAFPERREGIDAANAETRPVSDRLAGLQRWREGQTAGGGALNDEQHTVLHALGQLVRQQRAYDTGVRQFASATKTLALPSAKGWLAPPKGPADEANTASGNRRGQWWKGGLSQYLTAQRDELRTRAQQPWLQGASAENQRQVRDLMVRQPRFADLVSALEARNTAAEAEFELKDSVREALEDQVIAGDEGIDTVLREALKNPENLRVGGISVTHTVSSPSAFATPPFLIGFGSKAELQHTQQRGSIKFEYGADPDRPMAVVAGGGFALQDNASPLHTRLQQRGVRFHYLANLTPPAEEAEEVETQEPREVRGPTYETASRPGRGGL